MSQTVTTNTTSATKTHLSTSAENTLFDAVGAAINDPHAAKSDARTVREVILDMSSDVDGLAIALDFGPGESGIDQLSWNLEVNMLKRAYMKHQKAKEIDAYAHQIQTVITKATQEINTVWIQKTNTIMEFRERARGVAMTRQEVDDYKHAIFAHGEYISYLESSINLGGDNQIRVSFDELSDSLARINSELAAQLDATNVSYEELAQTIVDTAHGDIDELLIYFERHSNAGNYSKVHEQGRALLDVMSSTKLNEYRRWVYALDLNIREILATEKSATNGRLTDKAVYQLKDMFDAGEELLGNLHSALKEYA